MHTLSALKADIWGQAVLSVELEGTQHVHTIRDDRHTARDET